MPLTSASLPHFLVGRGLISLDSVVDGDLMIVESNSRNRNFKVIRKHSPGFFVKEAQQWKEGATGLLQREASCYWLAVNEPGFKSLASLVPAYKLYDPKRYILVMELLPDGENLGEYHRRLGAFPLGVAARLGEVIGTYHHDITLKAAERASSADFPRKVPWILSAHRLDNSPMQTLGGANQQILNIINQYADFHRYLDALREQWRFDSFIHGDMKWENCIVYSQNGELQVKAIDWETADFGDACWDVGAILQAYLTFWIMSLPVRGDVPADQYLAQAPYSIEAMQPAIRAFWLAYGRRQGLSEVEWQDVLHRSMGYGAARMLQTAFESMYYSPRITVNALSLLQVSLNILSDTKGAVRDLLNL